MISYWVFHLFWMCFFFLSLSSRILNVSVSAMWKESRYLTGLWNISLEQREDFWKPLCWLSTSVCHMANSEDNFVTSFVVIVSQLHNWWYFLVAFCFHCCMCNVCDQRSHIGRWVRMFIWSSDLRNNSNKLWPLYGLDNLTPPTVRTETAEKRKVGLLTLLNDQNKKAYLFWE